MTTAAPSETDHLDLCIVGAGISGIDTAVHVQRDCPDMSFTLLEGRDDLGGTWDLFRYPGVRSDSDMHTLGFGFRPWTKPQAIASGSDILAYLRETAREFGIEGRIRLGHRVQAADFDRTTGRWTIRGEAAGREFSITASMLAVCAGYFRYDRGHCPNFEGQERFRGSIVHPQQWPEDLEYRGKRVVVIGSGATAMTLVPAMADAAEHVTMVQRSPTWVVARPSVDAVAGWLKRLLPDRVAYRLVRAKNVALGSAFYRKTRRDPHGAAKMLLAGVRKGIGDDLTEQHFTPTYSPWDQRLCLLPDGDLFDAINRGDASVVTDTIETFTDTGVQLSSGRHLDADIIVTATGLELARLGNIALSVDGNAVDPSQCWTYKGLALSGVPNLVYTFGFVNASWTLRADLVAAYTARLLNHLRDTGVDYAEPTLRPGDDQMTARPYVDEFTAGYMQRSIAMFPKQGDRPPWINPQHVARTRKLLSQPIADPAMRFTRVRDDGPVDAGRGDSVSV